MAPRLEFPRYERHPAQYRQTADIPLLYQFIPKYFEPLLWSGGVISGGDKRQDHLVPGVHGLEREATNGQRYTAEPRGSGLRGVPDPDLGGWGRLSDGNEELKDEHEVAGWSDLGRWIDPSGADCVCKLKCLRSQKNLG